MFFVTGSKGGLGRYLSRELKAVEFDRTTDWGHFKNAIKAHDETIIVHSAFNLKQKVDSIDYGEYIKDTLILTQKLVDLKPNLFVFISSVDVYPLCSDICDEEMNFDVLKRDGLYSRTKLLCEEIVRMNCANHLILRPTALFGTGMRQNSILKLLNNEGSHLTLSAISSFNITLYEDVLNLIHAAITNKKVGTFNLASSSNLVLSEIEREFGIKNISYGNFDYFTNSIDITKAAELCPNITETSMNKLKSFLSQHKK